MLVKIIVVFLFLVILLSLGSALIFLVKDKGTTNRTVRALTIRIALSIFAFLLLMISYWLGLIQPHGISG